MTQQIHSLRASGVKSFQAARTAGMAARAFRKSGGTVCATPVAIVNFMVLRSSSCRHISLLYHHAEVCKNRFFCPKRSADKA
jgi:hypothetical protein